MVYSELLEEPTTVDLKGIELAAERSHRTYDWRQWTYQLPLHASSEATSELPNFCTFTFLALSAVLAPAVRLVSCSAPG